MLRSYLDESGDVSDPNVEFIGVGGAISSLEQWEQLEIEWKGVLDKVGVSDLHMKHFAHFRGEFTGWSEDKRREFLSGLMDIAEKYVYGYIIAIIPKDVWQSLDDAQKSKLSDDPYYPCFIACLIGSVEYTRQVGPEEKVELFVANRDGYEGQAHKYWHNSWNSPEAPSGFSARLGSITFASPSSVIPLQVADLVVYECVKHFRSIHQTGQWKERAPLSRIKDRILYNTFFDREKLNLHFGIS